MSVIAQDVVFSEQLEIINVGHFKAPTYQVAKPFNKSYFI